METVLVKVCALHSKIARHDEWPTFGGTLGATVASMPDDLDEPLRLLGTYKVAIRVGPEMTPEVTVEVEPKG